MKHSTLQMSILALAGSLSAFAAAPQYGLSYFATGVSQTAITNSIVLPPTTVGTTTSATVVIFNNGDGNGQINSVTGGAGTTFQITGLPALPTTLQPNTNVTFIVSFTPTSRGPAAANVTINFDTGPQTIAISGQGVGASYKVENITSAPATTIPANGTLSFPNTLVGKSVSATVRITNDGDSPGSFTPAVVGSSSPTPAFTLTPAAQPITLSPKSSTTFFVLFSPKDIGGLTAQLSIGSISINLAGTGEGANLTFTADTQQVASGGTIFFPNTVVGTTASVTLTIVNTGNIATSLTSVGTTAPFSTGFQATLNLLPGKPATIGLLFSPNAVGASISTLVINNNTFTLQGVGSAPASLPAISFTGVGDTAAPLQQPSIGLQLAAPYAQDLAGTLTLTFTPDAVADDPTIQFATGGRTVNFKIPANSIDAVFGQVKQVPFASGTVAGTITLTPAFTIGAVDVTPKPAPAKTVLVASSAPVLRSLQIGTRTGSSFELLITGYATSRSVSGLQLTFTPSAGSTLSATSIPVNSDSAFSAWYQTAASQTVGSQFTASLTINLGGNGNAVQAVSVSASNAQGASNAVNVNVQ